MKTLAKITTLISLLFIAGCSNQESTTNTTEKKTAKQIEVKPPTMDLHTAAFMGNINEIKQHIAAGTDLNTKDQFGSTALITAASFGKTEIAKVLIDGGAGLNIQNNDGSSPLHIAAFFCHSEIVEALLNKGADKNLKNIFGSTALETVSGPFPDAKPIYDELSKALGPLGLKFDYDYIEATRPKIAEMLQSK